MAGLAQDLSIMSVRSPCVRAVLLSLALSGAAQAAELPKSAACRTALNALEQAEDALAAASPPPSPISTPDVRRRDAAAASLAPQRQRVADACLGGLTTSPPPSQHTWAAPTGPRVAPVPPRPPVVAQAVGSEPLLRWQPPVTVTHCMGATCTASDGSTLTRVGPTLVGPRGACTLQGSLLNCP